MYNVISDTLSRLEDDHAHAYAVSCGSTRLDIEETCKWYLTDRASSHSLILPTDHSDRVMAIMRKVEKRAFRTKDRSLLPSLSVVVMGKGLAIGAESRMASPCKGGIGGPSHGRRKLSWKMERGHRE